MALEDYTYSIYDDFVINHKVDITILQIEIKASTIILTNLHHIDADLDNDECVVWFDAILPQDEEDELAAIVAAHTGLLPGGINPESVGGGGDTGDIIITLSDHSNPAYFKFKDDSYKTAAQFIFNGTNGLGIPTGVKAVLKDCGGLRLYDRTNSEIIFSWENMSESTDYNIYSQSSNIVWPTGECILEIQGKRHHEHEHHNHDIDLLLSCLIITYCSTVIDNIP